MFLSKRILWFILILALSLRLAAALFLGDSIEGEQQVRIQDQVSYQALAQSLMAGNGYTFPEHWYPFTLQGEPTAHWSFAYPAYLAGVYSLFGFHPLAARILQAAISGALAAWLFFRLGRRLFGETVGAITALLGSVYAYFIFFDAALMTESFYLLGIVAMLDLAIELIDLKDQAKPRHWIVFGCVLGATVLLRQAILPWLPVLFLWLVLVRPGTLISRMRGPILAGSILALWILPWTVRNWVVYQQLLPLNSNAGYALYASNHPHHGTQFDQDYVAPLPEDILQSSQPFPNEAEWNNLLTERGLEFMLDDPQRYVQLTLSRVGVFFNFWFSSESSLLSDLMRVASFGIYLPFFIFGSILALRSWRRSGVIFLFAAVYTAMHVLTWAGVRYRLPVDAALMPFAGLAIATLAQRFSRKFYPGARLALALPAARQNVQQEETP